MKRSLFWWFFFIGLLPILSLLIIGKKLKVPFIQDLFSINNVSFIILEFGIYILLVLIVSNLYFHSIQILSDNIDNLSLLSKYLQKKKYLPNEIRQLYLSVISFSSATRDDQAFYLSDKKLFNSTLKNMNDGIFIVNENEIVTLINPSACSIFGIDRNEVIGHTLAEALRNYRINELYDLCASTKQQEMISFETAPKKAFIQCIATPLDPELAGSIMFLVQDLTRLRQLEIVRRDFVSNVSHELRTPLASLKLIAETLQEGALNDPPAAKKFLERMDGEVDNLSQLVEELLELSRIESGKVPLDRQWIGPVELLKKARDRMLLQAERAGLRLFVNGDELLPKIFIDPTRLEQVLVNLIHNAIKFTNPGGEVEISVEKSNTDIVFHVKDTGIGIPPKDLERIFERFYKTDRSRTERGTGLGLSISRHLVEAHKGRIWAESQPGKGSTFSFSIPIQLSF